MHGKGTYTNILQGTTRVGIWKMNYRVKWEDENENELRIEERDEREEQTLEKTEE